jgi:hypothetical protein
MHHRLVRALLFLTSHADISAGHLSEADIRSPTYLKMAYELQPQLLWTQERTGGILMKYAGKNNERESDSKSVINSSYSLTKQGHVIKRLLLLVMMAISLVFAGAQSIPTAKAGAPCDMVCNDFIDPTDGKCYRTCCPDNNECKIRCITMPCEK